DRFQLVIPPGPLTPISSPTKLGEGRGGFSALSRLCGRGDGGDLFPRRPAARVPRIPLNKLFDEFAALVVGGCLHDDFGVDIEISPLDPLAADAHARTARGARLDRDSELAAVECRHVDL